MLKLTKNSLLVFTALLVLPTLVQAMTFQSNVPPEIQTRTNSDLAFIATIEGANASPLHQQIYGPVSGAAYLQWFSSRITSIGYDAQSNDGSTAYVAPYTNPHRMMMTKYFILDEHPQIARLLVIFHEARHSEAANGYWNHVLCPTPFLDASGHDMNSIWSGVSLAGKPGCDDVALGAYGSSTIMVKNISKVCTNCSEKVKMDAQIFADDQIERIIDPSAHTQLVNDFSAL